MICLFFILLKNSGFFFWKQTFLGVENVALRFFFPMVIAVHFQEKNVQKNSVFPANVVWKSFLKHETKKALFL